MFKVSAETDFLGKAKRSITDPKVLYTVLKKSALASVREPAKAAKSRTRGLFPGGKRMAAAIRTTATTQRKTGNVNVKIFASIKYKHAKVKIKGKDVPFAACK